MWPCPHGRLLPPLSSMLTCLSQALRLSPCTCRCSLGKGALAATHLLAAQEAVEQQLAALKINMEVWGG